MNKDIQERIEEIQSRMRRAATDDTVGEYEEKDFLWLIDTVIKLGVEESALFQECDKFAHLVSKQALENSELKTRLENQVKEIEKLIMEIENHGRFTIIKDVKFMHGISMTADDWFGLKVRMQELSNGGNIPNKAAGSGHSLIPPVETRTRNEPPHILRVSGMEGETQGIPKPEEDKTDEECLNDPCLLFLSGTCDGKKPKPCKEKVSSDEYGKALIEEADKGAKA